MKKIIALLLIISLFGISSSAIASCKDKTAEVIKDLTETDFTYLVTGLDSAAGNTDVILLINYNSISNRTTFIHIPRDTYFNFGEGQNKINQFVPSKTSKGASTVEAMHSLTSELSRALGIHIDGYAAYTTDAISRIIDAFGGIEIDLPNRIVSVDENGNSVTLDSGRHNLSGSEAIAYLRYRAGYAMGDLGRIDAQKLLISAFIKKARSSINPETAIKLISDSGEGVTTDLNVIDFAKIILKNRGRISNMSVGFANLPGRSLESVSGLSYYSVNKKASGLLLGSVFATDLLQFDADGKFLNNNDINFVNIYNDEEIGYKVYTDSELSSMKIAIK